MAANELVRGSPTTTSYTKSGGSPTSLYEVQSVQTSSQGTVLDNFGDGAIFAKDGGVSTIASSVTIETWDINVVTNLEPGDQLTALSCAFDGRTQASSGKTCTLTLAGGTVESVNTAGGTTDARATTIGIKAFSSDGSTNPFSWAYS